MKDKVGPKIIGGDFNLNPDTESIKMFEEAGYKNLIKDFKIENTRNEISWREFKEIKDFHPWQSVAPSSPSSEFQKFFAE